jgi:ADP-glucose pyrophosphorylase
VSVGKYTTIKSSVIYDNVEVQENVFIDQSVVAADCIIEKNVTMTNCVVGDGETIPAGAILKHTSVWKKPIPTSYPSEQIGNPLQE